eukprot:g44797.t1
MISELFQLDEPPKRDENGSSLNENSDSYSEDEDLPEDSDENGSFSNGSEPSNDSKAVAIIKSVGELSVPEKYKSIHQIRGLKAVDGSVKKETDLPAVDPSIPIPLKYADESECTGHKALKKQIALFLDKATTLQKYGRALRYIKLALQSL